MRAWFPAPPHRGGRNTVSQDRIITLLLHSPILLSRQVSLVEKRCTTSRRPRGLRECTSIPRSSGGDHRGKTDSASDQSGHYSTLRDDSSLTQAPPESLSLRTWVDQHLAQQPIPVLPRTESRASGDGTILPNPAFGVYTYPVSINDKWASPGLL
ncbi:hypothetical protein BC827DRAFT_365741 [Russula dissimulans]|nr:hypothetical protein BC827DRAFT_365741 [Russula dissimulans]